MRDSVLGVEDMKRLAPLLSEHVDMLEIPGGRHDLALSAKPAREAYTRGVVAWVKKTLGDQPSPKHNTQRPRCRSGLDAATAAMIATIRSSIQLCAIYPNP